MGPSPQHADVIIVGAGLSGLQSAVTLHQSGLSVLVLEARNRVGGKTWSVDFANGVSDMGAAWINDTNQSHMYALAQQFKLETITQNTTGSIVMHDLDGSVHTFPYGSTPRQEVEAGGVNDMIRVRDLFEELCQRIDIRDPLSAVKALDGVHDGMSMTDFVKLVKGGETAMRTVGVWTRAMLGLEPEEVGALFFLTYCKSGGGLMSMRSDQKNGGQYLRMSKGTQSFSRCLASLLPSGSIILNSPVKAIATTATSTKVSTANVEYTCSRVVVSLPTTLYKAIVFTPPLPRRKQQLASATVHGHTSKALLAYSHPWWRQSNFCGLTQSLKGLVAVTRDTSNDASGHFSLLCFLVGEPGRQWAKKSPSERKKLVLLHISSVFGPLVQAVPEPIDYVDQIWSDEEWSAGCPCPAMPPGLMTEVGDALRETWGPVHFVGTETAYEWRGYMEGAVRSGIRGAGEVTRALRKAKL